jgi:putative transposase
MGAEEGDVVPTPRRDPLPELTGFSESQRARALERWRLLRPQLEDRVSLAPAAKGGGVPERTLRRWRATYRADSLAGFARKARSDRGQPKMAEELRLLIEGLALRPPRRSVAVVHREAASIAAAKAWPVPAYPTVYGIVRNLDPGLVTLALEGTKRYRTCLRWCIAERRPGPTRSGRPTTASWTSESWAPKGDRRGRG